VNLEKTSPGLIPLHGGYRKLKSFQVAQLAYDVTVRFCDRYVEKRSRTHDQMSIRGQAAVFLFAARDDFRAKGRKIKRIEICQKILDRFPK
jgi:hypothetical protein